MRPDVAQVRRLEAHAHGVGGFARSRSEGGVVEEIHDGAAPQRLVVQLAGVADAGTPP
jgi:hypothetical protein